MNRTAMACLALMSAIMASPAVAQNPAGTIALSPEERAAVLDAAASRPDTSLPINGLDRQIHGEVGFEIGSRGQRALYGSTIVPLGENGSAAFSFMTDQGRWGR